jgi:hypothetical protein
VFFHWIYEVPAWEGALILSLSFLLVFWVATLLFHRYLHAWFHTEHRANDMVGFVLSSYFVLYGLLVGLTAVAVYQNLTSVTDLVSREAASLGAIYRDLGGYPQPGRELLRGELRDYTQYEIERDWPQLRHGIVPAEGTHRLGQFVDELLRVAPQGSSQEIIHGDTLRQLSNYMDLRTERLDNVTLGLPQELWWVVGIGGLVTLLLVSVLSIEIHVHLILGAALSGFRGLVIYVIASMDHPFMGSVSVDVDPFRQVYATIMLPSDWVNRSMATLIAVASKLGAPHIDGAIPVAGKAVPGLHFGPHPVNNSVDVVDEISRQQGGVVSTFVKSGDDYIRVATSTRAPDGSRATKQHIRHDPPESRAVKRSASACGK